MNGSDNTEPDSITIHNIPRVSKHSRQSCDDLDT